MNRRQVALHLTNARIEAPLSVADRLDAIEDELENVHELLREMESLLTTVFSILRMSHPDDLAMCEDTQLPG